MGIGLMSARACRILAPGCKVISSIPWVSQKSNINTMENNPGHVGLVSTIGDQILEAASIVHHLS